MNCRDYDYGKTITGVLKKLSKKEDELMLKYDLSHFHARYIMNIHKFKSINMTDLTLLAGVDKANTTRVVKDLLNKQVVTKSGGERKFNLSLTEKGKKIAEFFKERIENFMKKVFKDFKAEEIKALQYLLEKMFLGTKNALEE